jgi:hypothetical protein
MLGTLNPHFQEGLLVPPKSRRAGRVEDLVASKFKPFSMRLPLLRKMESLEIMWSSRLSVTGRNLSSYDNILPLDMKDPTRMSPELMAQFEVIKRCCKVLNNFDKSLELPTLFSAQNPPENT